MSLSGINKASFVLGPPFLSFDERNVHESFELDKRQRGINAAAGAEETFVDRCQTPHLDVILKRKLELGAHKA